MEKLRSFFPRTNFTVTEKADSKYPIVSAASVCAKVMRDRIVQNWKYIEGKGLYLDTFKLGSGYPADPDTKKFLERSIDPVFGFPTLARFSWSTITKALEKGGCKCDFNEPEDDSQDQKGFSKQQRFLQNFFQKKNPAKGGGSSSSKPAPRVFTQPMAMQTASRVDKPRTNADTYRDDRQLTRVMKWNV